jgi:site-specific recombinase XerD
VTKTQLEQFIADLTGKDGDTPAKPKSVINFIITLTAFFNYAIEEGWRGENPAAKIRRPNLDETTTAILSPAQAKQLLDEACKPAYVDVFPALLIQLFAGPRRSELPHVTWETIKDPYWLPFDSVFAGRLGASSMEWRLYQ